MATKVIIPKIGEKVEVCQLLEWFMRKGDIVKEGDLLFAVESDKACFDIEAPASGVLQDIFVEAGAEVPVMTVVGVIETENEET